MARIKDIAELAGVSRGTVDRVLNNRSGVSPQTAEKIKEIAKALDYRPNKAGLALAAQKKKNKIGVVLFSKNNPFFDEVSEGVQTKARELADYGVTTLTRRDGVGSPPSLLPSMNSWKRTFTGCFLPPTIIRPFRKRLTSWLPAGSLLSLSTRTSAVPNAWPMSEVITSAAAGLQPDCLPS